MQRKKLKKTNEINRSNTQIKLLVCALISVALLTAGGYPLDTSADDRSTFYIINGHVTDCGGGAGIGGAIVTATNPKTGATYNYPTPSDGYYSVTFSKVLGEYTNNNATYPGDPL